MHAEFQLLMNQATELTRSGNLAAATAAIQTALRRGAHSARPHQGESDVIDVEAREIPDSTRGSGSTQTAAEGLTTRARNSASTSELFIPGSFRNAAGQRSYKLYVPPNAGEQPLPLVVMLHGCTQNADDFAAGTDMNKAARDRGFYVLYANQSPKASPQMCWSWFKHNHQQSGRGEPSILAGMTQNIIATRAIDTRRVYVAGLSAGGAMAAILAGAYPDLYAAVGVHSGLAPGAASDLPSALAAMKSPRIQAPTQAGNGVPTIVFHGDRDAIVHPHNAQNVIAASAGSSVRVKTLHVPGVNNTRHSTKHVYQNTAGNIIAERWEIHGAGHAWAGGTKNGSYTDSSGPDATAEMLRFFFESVLNNKR